MNVLTFYLFSLCIIVSANLDQQLRTSIDTAMKCRFREPPKGPVMAVSPSKFVQIVVLLHEKFNSPTCGRSPKSPISVIDEKTWPYCIFGKCNQGRCQCAGNFEGPKCSVYSKKCWLMYCYLTSCHPAHQSLHCICDPSLYGTKITTGIHWYDKGKSSIYIPPPPGWHDEPSDMIQLIDKDASIEMGSRTQNVPGGSQGKYLGQKVPGRSQGQYPARGPKNQYLRGRNSHRGLKPGSRPGQNVGSPDQSKGGRQSGVDSAAKRLGGSDYQITYNEDAAEDEDTERKKTDVEEALEQLDERSLALKLSAHTFNVSLLLFVCFMIQSIVQKYDLKDSNK